MSNLDNVHVTQEDLLMVRDYLRANGHYIRELAEAGESDAKNLEAAYRKWHSHKLNVLYQNEVVVRVRAFIWRDCTVTERQVLEQRFGHKVGHLS